MNRDQEFIKAKSDYDHYINSAPDRVIKYRRELQYLAGGGSKGGKPGERGEIEKFSPATGRRLRRFIDNYYTDFKGMVTLTYGADWPEDGRVVKRHLSAFFEQLRRNMWFERQSLVWWLEFQHRGAPHIHMIVTSWISKATVSKAWSRISGAPIKTCTRVEQLRRPDDAGAYAAKYAAKQEQKGVPPGYVGVGRFWGRRGARPCEGAIIPRVVAAAIPVRARDLMRQLRETFQRKSVAKTMPYTLRVYEHEGGWSIYGTESEINQIWHCLQDHSRAALDQRAKQQGSSPPKM